MHPTLLASAARILWRLLERDGIDPEQVFREVGLDPDHVRDPRARYADTKTRAAWQIAARLIDNPCFGLLAAEVWRPTDFHALGYAFLSSQTLQTAIERVVRYNTVVDSVIRFEATLGDNQLRLTYRIMDPAITEVSALQDGRLAVVFGLCREAYGDGFSPAEVSVTHRAPSCRADYYGLFRCPVHFDAPQPEIVLDRALVEAPLPAASRELAVANDAILADYLRTLQHSDIVSRVKTAMIEHLPSGAPSAETVAKDLFISARTLHRRLADAQTSFSETLEVVRRELAEKYIADPTRSLSEISFLLGFSEQPAFSRAFRRWTGQSPSAARGTFVS
jgi:AraC-like DNA-binding protein